MRATLVIGGNGYVGRALAELLPSFGISVSATSRRLGTEELVRHGADLDRLLAGQRFDQVVLTAQLTAHDMDWLLERIDGPRWVVFSSAQLASRYAAPATDLALAREQVALARGATVLRPTMIFGRAGDRNVSRIVRNLRRWHVPVQIGDGTPLVQPVHVADVVSLVARHSVAPQAGLFALGGDEAVPTSELLDMVREVLGVRLSAVRLPPALLRAASGVKVAGLRKDQILRLQEDKVVDIEPARQSFDWQPGLLPHRVEQAVWEVTA